MTRPDRFGPEGSSGGDAYWTGDVSPAGEAYSVGDASRADDASSVGEASWAGDVSPAGEASSAGDASSVGDTSRAGDASPASETSPAGDESPAGDASSPADQIVPPARQPRADSLLLTDYRLQQRDYLLRIARAMSAQLDLREVLALVIRSAVQMTRGRGRRHRHARGRWRRHARRGQLPAGGSLPGRSRPPPGHPSAARRARGRRSRRRPGSGLGPRAERSHRRTHGRMDPIAGHGRARSARHAAGHRRASGSAARCRRLPCRHPAARARRRDGGPLVVFRSEGAAVFTPLDDEVLEAFADQAAVAIQNAYLHARLAARERQLTDVVARTPAGIVLAGTDGRVVGDNRAARALLASDGGPMIGTTLADALALETDAAPPSPWCSLIGRDRDGASGYLPSARAGAARSCRRRCTPWPTPTATSRASSSTSSTSRSTRRPRTPRRRSWPGCRTSSRRPWR